MSMEDELRSNTVAMDALTQSIDTLVSVIESLSKTGVITAEPEPAAVDTAEKQPAKKVDIEPEIDSEPDVEPAKELKKGSVEDDEPKESDEEPKRTQKELKELLVEYKEKFGLPLAKKLLTKVTDGRYKTSSEVLPDDITSIYDRVYELTHGEEL